MKTIRDLLNHDRARTSWICRAGLSSDGKPEICRIARIVVVPPRDGAGRLYVGVTDWGTDGTAHSPVHFVNMATGYGYDKRTAALEGATVGGFTLGNHCNRNGCLTLSALCNREGWEEIGG